MSGRLWCEDGEGELVRQAQRAVRELASCFYARYSRERSEMIYLGDIGIVIMAIVPGTSDSGVPEDESVSVLIAIR